jgi:hypothetical protein
MRLCFCLALALICAPLIAHASHEDQCTYASLRTAEEINRADVENFAEVTSRLRKLGYQVVVLKAPKNLKRSPYFIKQLEGEEDVQPALTLVSHYTGSTGDARRMITGAAFTPRDKSGVYFNTTFWVDRSAGKPRIYILDGFQRTNHVARKKRREHAPDVFNWNSLGVELFANNERDVQPSQIRAFVDIVLVYSQVIGQKVRVYGHGDINDHKTRDEGQRGTQAAQKALLHMKF